MLGLAYHFRLPKFVTLGDDAKLILYDEETKMQERVFHARFPIITEIYFIIIVLVAVENQNVQNSISRFSLFLKYLSIICTQGAII